MKIGISGLGSIGKRHARCLRQLGCEDIIALRTKKGTTKTLPLPVPFKKVLNLYDVIEYLDKNPEIANLNQNCIQLDLDNGIKKEINRVYLERFDEIKKI